MMGLLDSMRGWLTLIGGALALVGVVYGGVLALDGRYYPRAVAEQQYRSLDRTLKEGQYQQLRREEFELIREQQRRPLSHLELRRLKEIEDALRRLEHDMK